MILIGNEIRKWFQLENEKWKFIRVDVEMYGLTYSPYRKKVVYIKDIELGKVIITAKRHLKQGKIHCYIIAVNKNKGKKDPIPVDSIPNSISKSKRKNIQLSVTHLKG